MERAVFREDGRSGQPEVEPWMVWNSMRACSSSRGSVKETDGRSVKREHQELVDTPDMAPAEDRHRFVSCARVGISIYEQV
jgi:hypothetical protein